MEFGCIFQNNTEFQRTKTSLTKSKFNNFPDDYCSNLLTIEKFDRKIYSPVTTTTILNSSN